MKRVFKECYVVLALVLFSNFSYGQVVPIRYDSLAKVTFQGKQKKLLKGFDSAAVSSKIKSAKTQLASAIGLDKLPKRDTDKTFKKFAIKGFNTEVGTMYQSTPRFGQKSNFVNVVNASADLMIYNFPLQLDLVNYQSQPDKLNPLKGNLFKFDKPDPRRMMLSKINEMKNFQKNILNGNDLKNYVRKGIQEKLKSNLPPEVLQNASFNRFINNPEQLKKLLTMEKANLEAQVQLFLEDTKKGLNAKKTGLEKDGQQFGDSLIAVKKTEITSFITELQDDLYSSGINENMITLFQKMTSNNISEKDLASFFYQELINQPKLSGFQKYYSRIKEFQVGDFGNSLPGSFLNRDMLLQGFNVSMKTTRGYTRVGISGNSDAGFPKDMGLNSSVFSIPRLYTYLSVPTTNFMIGSGKLSWVGMYDKQKSATNFLSPATLPKTNSAFTLSQDFKFQEFGKLTLEVSKSSTQYANMTIITPMGGTAISNNLLGNYFRDDFLQTLSLGANHAIEDKKTGLSSNMFFSYSGLGFQNPGSQSLGNRGMRFGGNAKKFFFKNKLSLSVRGDLKHTPINAETNAHWANFNAQLDSRFRISKKTSLNIKYIKNGINKAGEQNEMVYQTEKFQADFTGSYKLMGFNSFSFISLGRQNMLIPQSTQPSNFMSINYTQTVLFEGFNLSGNLFYNKDFSSTTLLGNMTNADLSCQYNLNERLSLSSGLTYLDNQQSARQFGIKQNIQLQLGKHFDISAYLDIRKNLITPQFPDLFSANRGDFSVRYYFGKL